MATLTWAALLRLIFSFIFKLLELPLRGSPGLNTKILYVPPFFCIFYYNTHISQKQEGWVGLTSFWCVFNVKYLHTFTYVSDFFFEIKKKMSLLIKKCHKHSYWIRKLLFGPYKISRNICVKVCECLTRDYTHK